MKNEDFQTTDVLPHYTPPGQIAGVLLDPGLSVRQLMGWKKMGAAQEGMILKTPVKDLSTSGIIALTNSALAALPAMKKENDFSLLPPLEDIWNWHLGELKHGRKKMDVSPGQLHSLCRIIEAENCSLSLHDSASSVSFVDARQILRRMKVSIGHHLALDHTLDEWAQNQLSGAQVTKLTSDSKNIYAIALPAIAKRGGKQNALQVASYLEKQDVEHAPVRVDNTVYVEPTKGSGLEAMLTNAVKRQTSERSHLNAHHRLSR